MFEIDKEQMKGLVKQSRSHKSSHKKLNAINVNLLLAKFESNVNVKTDLVSKESAVGCILMDYQTFRLYCECLLSQMQFVWMRELQQKKRGIVS